jgi:hypothetical protein
MKKIFMSKSGSEMGSGLLLGGCQVPGYQRIAEGVVREGSLSPVILLKRTLAWPWNEVAKPLLKRFVKKIYSWNTIFQARNNLVPITATFTNKQAHLVTGDMVCVRTREEIEATLDPFKELKGCAFLENMWQYCSSTQRVLQPVERFLDERDYKVKKAKGLVVLEGIICHGTPAFGRCDRCCHLFWREEWLKKIDDHSV